MQYKLRDRGSLTRLAAIAIASAGLAAFACGPSTKVEQTWTSPTARTQPLQKVVTVLFSDNATIRRTAEDRLARDLRAKGVEATPAYAILRDDEMADREKMKAKLLGMGYDGMVTMRVVDRYQELEYMPSTFDGYWGHSYSYFHSPGYYSPGYAYTETVVRVETSAYSLRTNQLVWSALTKTTGEEADELIEDTSQVIATQLTKRGLAT
jgi:hypothetical protein